MSDILVNTTLTKLGFKGAFSGKVEQVVAPKHHNPYVAHYLQMHKPETHAQSLFRGSTESIKKKKAPSPAKAFADTLLKSPTLRKLYDVAKHKRIKFNLKNNNSLSLGYVGDYKPLHSLTRQDMKIRGIDPGPASVPTYGIKFTKRFK